MHISARARSRNKFIKFPVPYIFNCVSDERAIFPYNYCQSISMWKCSRNPMRFVHIFEACQICWTRVHGSDTRSRILMFIFGEHVFVSRRTKATYETLVKRENGIVLSIILTRIQHLTLLFGSRCVRCSYL